MTSRERVLSALNFHEPDRVAVDFGGHRSSGIMAIAYKKLKDYLGITAGDIYVYDVIQQLAIVEPPVLDEFGLGRWGNGDVEVGFSSLDQLPYIMDLVRQAFELQMSDGSDI
jgi:predicted transport protein